MSVLLVVKSCYRCTTERFTVLLRSCERRNVTAFDRCFLDYSSKLGYRKADLYTNTFRATNKSRLIDSTAIGEHRKHKNTSLKSEDEADIFGLMDKTNFNRASEFEPPDDYEDEGDKREEKYLSRRPNMKNTMFWYSLQLKKLTKQRKLDEALKFFQKMIEVDRVQPDGFVYGVLIAGCGREGYTKMAFKLHRQMKDRGLNVHPRVYTSLFNACGNTPWPRNGLRLARTLYEEITNKRIILNSTNYHSAIKAFGRCGDLSMTLRLVDEMIEKRVGITTETFNFLLAACASERSIGFLHAIRIWRKLREKRIKPDVYSYNLLLRTVRDCGLGDPNVATELLLNSSAEDEQKSLPQSLPLDSVSDIERIPDRSSNAVSVTSNDSKLPDFLSPLPKIGSVVSLSSVDTAQDRLLMLGGLAGILHRMSMDKIKPDLKTLTELVEVIPTDDEAALIEVFEQKNIVPDVDFFNVLLKKRNCRGDFDSAKEVLSLIAQRGLYVDLATFGALSIGCKQWKDAEQLLNDMKTSGFRPNIKIVGAFVKIASYSRDFWYLMEVMKRIKAEKIPVDSRILEDMENCIVKTKRYIVYQEKAGLQSNLQKLTRSFRIFLLYYSEWLKESAYESLEHPWKQYETEQTFEDDDKNIKNKEKAD